MEKEDSMDMEASVSIAKLKEAAKANMISKLEATRLTSAEEERLARKAAWIAESREEVRRRQQFRELRISEMLPELPWKRILDELDPKDKELMSKMNLLWRDLLKTQQSQFLFQAVFPLIHTGLTRADILNIRAVCKLWQRSLENHLQNKFVSSPAPWPYMDDGTKPEQGNPFFVDNLEMKFKGEHRQVAQFRDQLRQTFGVNSSDKNPFISRKICLGFPYPLDEDPAIWLHQQYWREVEALLFQWGEHVWEAEVFIEKDPHMLDIYQQVLDLLKLMPNLRFLNMDGEYDAHSNEPRLRIKPLNFNEYYEGLKTFIRRQPLPVLPNLKILHVREILPPIVTALLRNSSLSLETVSVTEFFGSPHACTEDIRFPNLKRFYHCTKHPYLKEPTFVGDWPSLEELSLMYLNVKAAEVSKLFENLGIFGESLRKLSLDLQRFNGPLTKLDEKELKMLSLDLPNVQEFTLAVGRINLKTIDFILPMKALRKLTVVYLKYVTSYEKWRKREEDKPTTPSKSVSNEVDSDAGSSSSEEIVKFGKYTNRLYESNIWKLLPELEKITVKVVIKLKNTGKRRNDDGTVEDYTKPKDIKRKVYTRDGYQQHCRDFGSNGN